jgi:tetratricopeptide (TPR) repeat protein
VHSGKLVLEGNKLCLQCHKAEDYDTPNHTFHKSYGAAGEAVLSAAGIRFEVGSGTECINCHMHGQNFMGVDYRRDHSFRIPRPDLSEKMGTPNACNQCHTDKSNFWAQSHIEEWFGKSRPYQYGEAFFAASKGENTADKRLRNIFRNILYPPNIRAIAIQYMSPQPANDSLIHQAFFNTEPAIRIAAVSRYNLTKESDLALLLPLLNDETKAVRMETANKLAWLDTNLIPLPYRPVYRKVLAEKLAVLKYNADFPTGKFNLANFYYQQGKYAMAEEYFLKAIAQDEELYMAKINLAHLYSTMGQTVKAEKILEAYVRTHPEDGSALYDYGLILSENKKYRESLNYLLKASELLPDNSRIDYNIAMLYQFFGNQAKADEYLRRSKEKAGKQ